MMKALKLKFSCRNNVVLISREIRFLLVPKLSEQDLVLYHLQKIKVGKSTNIINHDVYMVRLG